MTLLGEYLSAVFKRRSPKLGQSQADSLEEYSEARLQTIFNHTKIAYVLLDRHYKVVSFNPLAADRYHREIDVTLKEGMDIMEYIRTKRELNILHNFRQAMAGQSVDYEIAFPQDDGVNCWYHVDMLPVRDENTQVLGIIISSEDITERKNAEIEKEKMTADILHHNKNLEQFAYIVSHNLRSPVANIIGLSKLINEHKKLSREEFDKCLEGLTTSAEKLDEVISDLNFILQSRKEIDGRKENVVFAELLENISTSISDQVQKQKVQIESDFKVPGIFAVKSYLHSIFINLLTNSIKYRRHDLPCRIKVSSAEHTDKIVLLFEDNGLGIDLEKHGDKIFGLYKKFHRHIDGKGMGLYMVKTQVEILGGKISVQSVLNKGCIFTVELPNI